MWKHKLKGVTNAQKGGSHLQEVDDCYFVSTCEEWIGLRETK